MKGMMEIFFLILKTAEEKPLYESPSMEKRQ